MWGPSLCLSADVWICGWLLFVVLDVVCIVAICWDRGLEFIVVCLGKGFSDHGCFFWGHHTITIPGSVHCQQYPFTRLLLETFRLILKVFFLKFCQPNWCNFLCLYLWRVSIHTRQLMFFFFQWRTYIVWTPILGSCPRSKDHMCIPGCLRTKLKLDRSPLSLLMLSSVVTVYEELRATKKFEEMNLNVDEAEHSMEMHLPYLAKVFQGYDTLKGWQSEISNAFLQCHSWKSCRSEGVALKSVLWRHYLLSGNLCRTSVKIVPILVGSCTPETEAMYGRLLAKYLDDPKNFFSVSSDFCHWGSRYALQSSCSSFSEFQVASTLVCCAYFFLNDGYLRYLVFWGEIRLGNGFAPG